MALFSILNFSHLINLTNFLLDLMERFYDNSLHPFERGRAKIIYFNNDSRWICKLVDSDALDFGYLIKEFKTFQALKSCKYIPNLHPKVTLENIRNNSCIVMENVGEVTLGDYAAGYKQNIYTRKEYERVLSWIIKAITDLYNRGYMQMDSNPGNFVINKRKKRAYIVDLYSVNLIPQSLTLEYIINKLINQLKEDKYYFS
jgi:serine/threonine protein kinase